MSRMASQDRERRAATPRGNEVVDVDVLQAPQNWRDSCYTIKEKLYNALISGSFADVKFTVGQVHKKEIPAHRFILFLNSSIFETLLEGSHLNKTVNITVSDVEPDAFMAFLRFLYTDDFDVHVKDSVSMLYLSKKYDIPRLALLCVEFIKNNINTKNVVSVLLSADALGESSISVQARQFLKRNIRYVIHEEDFLHLNSEELCQLFSSDELAVSELELFNAAVHWAIEECKRQKLEANPQNYRFVLKSVIPLIRFPLMDRKEFTLHVCTKNILTDAECLNIMMHWDVSPKEWASIPPLVFNNKPRRDVSVVQDAMVSFAKQHKPPKDQPREVVADPYYYDARVQQGYPIPPQSKPPPPARRHASNAPSSSWTQNQPFTYLADPSMINQPYPASYTEFSRF